MSTVDVLLGLMAAERQQAVRRSSVRHTHLADAPFGVVAYHLAGDRGAPVAVMWGRGANETRMFVVPEPRDRALRFVQMEDFAADLCDYLDDPTTQDPQILFANPATATWMTDIVGRFTWNLPIEGEGAVPEVIARAGKHLMFLGQEYRMPGNSTLVTAVDLLTMHFRTGQSPEEDNNLGALLGWVRPPAGVTGRVAAREGEIGPVAGPISNPDWDRRYLETTMRKWRETVNDPRARSRVLRTLEMDAALELNTPWNQMWTAHQLLAAEPPGSHVRSRRQDDIGRFRRHTERMVGNEARFSSRPTPLSGAKLLKDTELAAETLEVQMLLDDPLLMAAEVADGVAIGGLVIQADLARTEVVRGRKSTRPSLVIATEIPTTVVAGKTLYYAEDSTIRVRVESVGRVQATVVVESGALTKATMHRLPGLGDAVVFSAHRTRSLFQSGSLPNEEPWTHQQADVVGGTR